MTANPPPTGRAPLPGLRLPVGRRRLGPGAALSLLIHTGVIALLVLRGGARTPGTGRSGGGARGGGPAVNFFALPQAAPAEIVLPPVPPVPRAPRVLFAPLADLPAPRSIPIELPRIEPPRATLRGAAGVGAGAGDGGGGGGPGDAPGTGVGTDVGPGTASEGGYIFVASPRTAILPPLARVPGSVAGRTYRVRFWVSAEGRVTRVEVEPPIADADYSREFHARMMAYQFYPARTRDGRHVASVVPVPLRIGN